MSFLKKITNLFGNKHEKDVKGLRPLVEQINMHYDSFQSLTNDELRHKTVEFRERIQTYLKDIQSEMDRINKEIDGNYDLGIEEKEEMYETLDKLTKEKDAAIEEILMEILPEAFATVKETARRFKENDKLSATANDLDRDLAVDKEHMEINGDQVSYSRKWLAAGAEIEWDMVHYDVQLIGGIVLHQGKIAEMATGEGKTLVATLPAYLNALAGEGVHIVTVNDYLARRDSEWMGTIYNFLGITVDCIDKHRPNSDERRKAYLADITFGTNNEFGFDYLRDNMVRTPEEMVQRKHHYAMVDEVDSVLIDDARTPLIISGQVDSNDHQEFYNLKPRIQTLVKAQEAVVDGFFKEAKRLISEGKDGEKEGGLMLLRAHRGLPRKTNLIKYLGETGIKQILQKAENFYMQNNNEKMPEVDKELFFVIEEKQNSVDLTEKGIELITREGEDQEFFVMPDVGAEIAELEKQSISDEEKISKKDQLMQDFGVKSERIHNVSQLLKAYSLFEKDKEYVVMDQKVKIVDENTGRIMDGRRYSDGLHQAIEAKENVKVEAASQTMATVTLQNYFRMYHKLAGMTGTAETEAGEFWEIYKLDVVVIPTNRPIVRDDMEDLVYKTKKEKYNAILEEVLEQTGKGRPVLVGTTNVEVSEKISAVLNKKNVKHNVLNAKHHSREAEIVAEAGRAGSITIATNMAGRGTDIKISDEVKKAGGLCIVGSERHDSRRIDRQLRGRAGRQGDPGSSQFFVSLEDDLMRLFGSDKISRVMDKFGYEEGEVIQHSMITGSIERAQTKVEENHFGIRKRLLEYDDVMNNQRNAIYTKRRHAVYGERISVDIINMMYDLCEEIVTSNQEQRDYENFKLNAIINFSVDTAITDTEFNKLKAEDLTETLFAEARSAYGRRKEKIVQTALPVLQSIHRERGETVQNVAIPFSDGTHGISAVCNLQKALESNGKEILKSFEKSVLLAFIDESWKDHLRQMDELKTSVQAAAYEQKDPLLVYKIESFSLFQSTISEINRNVISFLFKGSLPEQDASQVQEARVQRTKMDKMKESRESDNAVVNPGGASQDVLQDRAARPKTQPVRSGAKVGRNDPCPCGSGKKYKKCHGANVVNS